MVFADPSPAPLPLQRVKQRLLAMSTSAALLTCGASSNSGIGYRDTWGSQRNSLSGRRWVTDRATVMNRTAWKLLARAQVLNTAPIPCLRWQVWTSLRQKNAQHRTNRAGSVNQDRRDYLQ